MFAVYLSRIQSVWQCRRVRALWHNSEIFQGLIVGAAFFAWLMLALVLVLA
jgi:hypothetical protein